MQSTHSQDDPKEDPERTIFDPAQFVVLFFRQIVEMTVSSNNYPRRLSIFKTAS